ncbi:Graves disease carrier protein-like [Homarus americanus]|uniref:Graves disease carrier protein-like n=1 Tax=Homarus americanus TaxID=6706 RepID=A0A8J5N1X0_HOMAM|nr:Graves disease carrier protein-like [Homarus americanus]
MDVVSSSFIVKSLIAGGVFSGLRNIVAKENVWALYKGNGAQMVRIFPYASTQFTSFELYKKVSGEHLYTGILNAATTIFQTEGGMRALYRGFTATVCGMIPYAGLSFYCFEQMKYLCMKHLPDQTCRSCDKNTGAIAQSFSYPFDVTRRRMQLAWMTEETRKFGMGMVDTLRLIYKENGVTRGLYRGMSINYMRAIPMVAVSFSTYELTKQMLGLDTGLAIKMG